jgi:nitrate/TMAO reductase-like tetraheme cytochrome c subunit
MDNFYDKVDKTDTCWNWFGSTNEKGYGLFRFNGKTSKAHRVSYILANGSIDPHLVIDHLCKNKKCVNPDHLDLVTQKENVIRGLAGKVNNPQSIKTHCPNGHEYSRIDKNGYRLCGKCRSIQTMKSRKNKTQ